jgi:colanic acid/amylovoran biosynthesis glycosyltransferase
LRTALTKPKRFAAAAALAFRMARRAERSLAFHLAYLAEACRIVPWLQGFGATHVHAHFGTNGAEVAMLASSLGGPPYSFTVHGPTEFDRPSYLGIGEKIRHSAFVVAITSYGRSQLYRWVERQHWSKIEVVHCGLESEFFDAPPTPPPSAARLACIGRLVEQKGQLLLIEAARLLAERGVAFELVLVGGGGMRATVDDLISQYRLDGMVRTTGAVSAERLRDELLQARALVLPSFAEGLPMVIMEAMALRRPVISTFVAGIPELVQPGTNGWLVPAASVEALAEAMADCLSKPIGELAAMGEAAYRRARVRHSVDTQAEELASLFARSSG